jgi:hypothetical protein
MRRMLFALATSAAILSAGALTSNRVEAMTLPGASGLATAIHQGNVVDQVRWWGGHWGWRHCRHWWNGRWHPWCG